MYAYGLTCPGFDYAFATLWMCFCAERVGAMLPESVLCIYFCESNNNIRYDSNHEICFECLLWSSEMPNALPFIL